MRLELRSDNIPAVIERVIRRSGKKSVVDLAEAAGVTSNSLHSWKRGAVDPRLPQFLWVVNAAGYRLILEEVEE